MSRSLAEQIAILTPEEREEIFKGYSEADYEKLQYDWGFWGRPEQSPPEGDWHIFLALAGRGWGKGNGLVTKVPTPSGWTTVGELKAGDYVFDENGRPTRVIRAFDPYTPDKMFKLTFSDGTSVTADGTHLWDTWEARDRKSYNRRNDYLPADNTVGLPKDWPNWTKENKNGLTEQNPVGPSTKTSQQIFDTLRHGKRGDLNHSIPVAGPLQYSPKDLPIDPYVFGVYLGDGSIWSGLVCSHNDEVSWMVEEIRNRGYAITSVIQQSGTNCSLINISGVSPLLKRLDPERVKTIPSEYLQGSEQQRRDLLAGLLDTDGYISPENGQIEFCAKRKEHAEAVVELARSLGQKPVMFEGKATLYGKYCDTKYRVKWRPTENFFYMPRKAAMFRPLGAQASRAMHRMIVEMEELPVETVRCISVASPNQLFLIGEGMIPTHNSRAGAEWVKKKVEENPGCKLLLLGRTSSDVRDVMVSAILEAYPPEERPEYIPSKRRLEFSNDSFALCTSSESPDQLRGPQAHFAWADELAALKAIQDSSGATAWSNLLAATRLGDNPQIFGTTTPKRTPLMKKLVEESKDPSKRIQIIRGSTFDNATLSENYLQSIVGQYGNSDLAKQELYGEMLGDAEGLIFTQEMIDNATDHSGVIPNYPLRFIAVDPSVSENPNDECGIIAVQVTQENDLTKRRAFILEDFSLKAGPDVWSKVVVDAAKKYNTKMVVYEKNMGGALVSMALTAHDPTLKTFPVVATKGKQTRAEPVVVVMQQGRVKFNGVMAELFDQLNFWDPESSRYSPDRLDAFVWAIIAGLISPPPGLRAGRYSAHSAAHRKLPQGLGSGRMRATGSIRSNKPRF